jgi:signal peptidase II
VTDRNASNARARNLAIFAGCALVWFLLDRVTKAFFEAQGLHTVVVPDILGLVRFDVVHNYGAAWSLFEGSVVALGIFSIVICGLVIAFALYSAKTATALEMLSMALIVAGGLGNMVDRFTMGYVVDFITPLFIDFPTFNVADIGVTCGIALFAIIAVRDLVVTARNQQASKEGE